MKNGKMILFGGIAMIVFAVLFTAGLLLVEGYYGFISASLGSTLEAFSRLVSDGMLLKAYLTIMSLLPLLLIPASLASYYALQVCSESGLRIGMYFGCCAALALVFSLSIWPSLNWALAETLVNADKASATHHGMMIQSYGINAYFGKFIGGYVGTICLSAWITSVSYCTLKHRDFPDWLGIVGATIAAVLVGGVVSNLVGLTSWTNIGYITLGVTSPWLLLFGVWAVKYSLKKKRRRRRRRRVKP